jgi:DMSO/TMAO reductase YedYZ molybdopterin-dependent catalytic subunit
MASRRRDADARSLPSTDSVMSRPTILVPFLACCIVMASPARARAQAGTVRISAQRDTTLTHGDLARLKRTQARVPGAGHAHDTAQASILYEGVAVSDLLALVGAPLGAALRGRAVASYVLIEAADGYRVVFSLDEISATDSTTVGVLLADRRNGEPLGAEEGPLRVIAPAARHSRWIRQVVRISVREAAP